MIKRLRWDDNFSDYHPVKLDRCSGRKEGDLPPRGRNLGLSGLKFRPDTKSYGHSGTHTKGRKDSRGKEKMVLPYHVKLEGLLTIYLSLDLDTLPGSLEFTTEEGAGSGPLPFSEVPLTTSYLGRGWVTQEGTVKT